MKFNHIFMLFNALILLFLCTLGGALFFVLSSLGLEAGMVITPGGLAVILGSLVLLLTMDGYFIYNRKLYTLLEREDWPALAEYLAKRLVEGRSKSRSLTRLLIKTYMIMGEPAEALAFEARLAARAPDLVEAFTLNFGAIRLLQGDTPGAVTLFSRRLDAVLARRGRRGAVPGEAEWLRWYYGFSLLLDLKPVPAVEQFQLLLKEHTGKRVLPIGLAAFFFEDVLSRRLPERSAEFAGLAEAGRRQTRARCPTRARWDAAAAKAGNDIYGLVIAANLKDAGAWLYPESPAAPAPGGDVPGPSS